ncbi:MAG TPA: ABC transporter ATP-binding protein [Actinomycetota bacterium]
MSLAASIGLRRGALAVDATVAADAGETVAIVGPNGAGKTSLARAIAGLDAIETGRITLDGAALDDPTAGVFVPPAKRSVGMMFQERLLFPHMNVAANVAFGLRAAGRRDASAVARDWLDRVGMAERAGDKPERLSGGQAALVALARALASSPRLLLLDEPFAALDAETKAATRRIVGEHLRALDGPALLITHDPLDAFSLAGRIAVLEQGRIAQQGTPAEIRERPVSRFVAELVGVNWFRGVAEPGGFRAGAIRIAAAHDLAPAADAIAVISPRAVALHAGVPEGSPRNTFAGRIADIVHTGEIVRVRIDGTVPLIAEITPSGASAISLQPGATVYAAVKATEVSVFGV